MIMYRWNEDADRSRCVVFLYGIYEYLQIFTIIYIMYIVYIYEGLDMVKFCAFTVDIWGTQAALLPLCIVDYDLYFLFG